MYGFSLNTRKTAEVQTYLLRTAAYRLYLNIYFTKTELLLHFYNNKAYMTGAAHADRGDFRKRIIHTLK